MTVNKKALSEMFSPVDEQGISSEFEMPEMDDGDSLYATAPVIISNEALPLTQSDTNQDIDYARRTLESLLNRSQQLVEIAIESAEQGQARDIEVAAKTIDSAIAAAEKLVDLHKKIKEINSTVVDSGSNNTFVNNQTINVTTADLLKELKGIKNVN